MRGRRSGLSPHERNRLGDLLRRAGGGRSQDAIADAASQLLGDPGDRSWGDWLEPEDDRTVERQFVSRLEHGRINPFAVGANRARVRAVAEVVGVAWIDVLVACGVVTREDLTSIRDRTHGSASRSP